MVFRFWRPIVSGWRRRPKSLACASFNPSRHTSKKGRSIWLWHPWGHDVQKWGYAAPGHLRQYAAALTMQWSVDRPGAPDVCLSKDQPHGWVETVGAGARKVRLLLLFAQVECRPSWAPPISMDVLSTCQRLMAIRVNAHCLRG